MSAALETVNLPHLPENLFIHVALYRNVQNAPYLRQQLLTGNAAFEYALIDASMILSRTHAFSAVFRAVNDYIHERLKSRNVHSEIVFSLSPANNIADSFRKFGIADSTKDLLVVKVSVSPEITHESVAEHLGASVEGFAVPFSDETLSSISDVAKIKKAYKLGALPPTPANTASNQEDCTQDSEKQRLETAILGAVALRGAV